MIEAEYILAACYGLSCGIANGMFRDAFKHVTGRLTPFDKWMIVAYSALGPFSFCVARGLHDHLFKRDG